MKRTRARRIELPFAGAAGGCTVMARTGERQRAWGMLMEASAASSKEVRDQMYSTQPSMCVYKRVAADNLTDAWARAKLAIKKAAAAMRAPEHSSDSLFQKKILKDKVTNIDQSKTIGKPLFVNIVFVRLQRLIPLQKIYKTDTICAVTTKGCRCFDLRLKKISSILWRSPV